MLNFADDMAIFDHWWLSGLHYQATADAWLANMDRERELIPVIFADTYGDALAKRWIPRWRMFFMAVSELFGYHEGNEWGIDHYLFHPRH